MGKLSGDTNAGETALRAQPKGLGLSSRLLFLTFSFVFLAEILIFFPSIASFTRGWLSERVEMAQTATLALEAAPTRMVSDRLSRDLLMNAQIVTVAVGSEMGRESILSPAMAIEGDMAVFDLRKFGLIPPILETLQLLMNSETKFIRILEDPEIDGNFIEVVVETKLLRIELWNYINRIFWLSLFISIFVGLLIYFALLYVVVRPIRRITKSIERFRVDPKDWRSHIVPSGRRDEIGRAETSLADMEAAVKASLQERERLAQLGEAMAKINHDLRNSLTSAQIISDGLGRSEDPRVQRAAPRLERAIERAVKLAEDTLSFGRSEPPTPTLSPQILYRIIEEAAHEALLGHDGVVWINDVDGELTAQVDQDHLHRIVVNLLRNAAQAIEAMERPDGSGRVTIRHARPGESLTLEIIDDGPGIPPRVQETLFKPFSASGTKRGSGLGLAIARELASGMGGDLRLISTGKDGTVFHLELRV